MTIGPGDSAFPLDFTVPERVLAIYAHPDDSEVACAGSLARWADDGAEITVVSVAAGDKGGSGSGDVVATRRREAQSAAQIVGVSQWQSFDLPDGEVENSVELRRQLVELIRRVQPDTVVSSDPTAVFFGESYINHRDHRTVGWAVLDAVSPAAATAAYFPDAGEPHAVSRLFLSGTLEPNCAVDISSTIDRKIAALACHVSQFSADEVEGDVGMIEQVVRSRAASEGARVGVRFAESYRRLRLA